ncbi:hypothetical protein OQA88_2103 [Cercophora sp. LCS_1]
MHSTAILSTLLLLSLATALPQGTKSPTQKLMTVHNIDSSVGGPNYVDISSFTNHASLDKCQPYNYPQYDYGYIEVEDALSCDFYSGQGCSGSHFTVVGRQSAARGGGKQPRFASYICEERKQRGGGGGRGKGKGHGN